MISKSRAQIALIVIFTMTLLFTIMLVESAEFEQTRHIGDTTADSFVTEVGIGFDADLVTVLDPNMDITAYLYFHDIKINNWEVLHNATLRLRTAASLDFDANSSITIYGTTDYSFFGPGTKGIGPLQSPAAILAAPLTSSSVTVNTSQFFGPGWKEIDVSVIVNEMKNNAHYDGPGMDRSDPGDNMAFIILGAEGSDIRYFYDYSAANNYEAQLVLHWTTSPPPPSGGSFNESYRGFNIFEIDHNGENRTGFNHTVNWNKLNMTQLTEIDSGGALLVNSATDTSITTLIAQQWDSLYNDTGGLGVNSYFVRFGLNVSGITNPEVFNDRVATIAGISTNTPVGGVGLMEGAGGDFVGLVMTVFVDDARYSFRLMDRSGVNRQYSGGSQTFNEATNEILYFEFDAHNTWESVRIFSDETYQNLIFEDERTYATASGPFRYPQIISSLAFGLSRINTAEYYTFLTDVLPENKTWTVTYENGTIINDDCPSYDCAIIFVDNLLGPDPEEPNPPGQGWDPTGPFSRFSIRLYILLVGFLMIFGPMIVWSMNRPSGYDFVIGTFIMVVGFALMYAAGQV